MALIKLKGHKEDRILLIESKDIKVVSKDNDNSMYKISLKSEETEYFTQSTPEEILLAVESVKDSKLYIRKDLKRLDQENSELQYKIHELESILEDERKISKEIQRLKNIENIPDDQIEVLELMERCFIKLSENYPELKEKAEEFKMMVELLKIVVKSK